MEKEVLKYNVVSSIKDDSNTLGTISYLCFETNLGKRTLKVNDAYNPHRNGYVSFPPTSTYEYIHYVAPWCHGAESIPERYSVDKSKYIDCPHCDKEFALDNVTVNETFVVCRNCYKTTLNYYCPNRSVYLEKLKSTVIDQIKNELDEYNLMNDNIEKILTEVKKYSIKNLYEKNKDKSEKTMCEFST